MAAGVEAVTYYVDATNGNDDHSGLSQDTPWKTMTRVRLMPMGSQMLTVNPDFETFTGTRDDGAEDTFAGWTSGGTNYRAEATTTSQSGSTAVKIVSTGGQGYINKALANAVTVEANTRYVLSFWTRGDGTYSGQYRVYDAVNASFITASLDTGVAGTTWVKKTLTFTTPAGCTSIWIRLLGNATNGSTVYFDNVSLQKQLGYASGDSIALKRGEVWADAGFDLGNDLPDNFTLHDYGTGALPRIDGNVVQPIRVAPTVQKKQSDYQEH